MFEAVKAKISENEPLSRHTTFGVGGPVRYWIEPDNPRELKKVLSIARKKKIRICVIGGGSNILAADKGLDAAAVHLGAARFREIRFCGSTVKAGAGVVLEHLIRACCDRGFGGLEGLTGIPGTVGGAIFMNSSYMCPISDFIESVKVMDRSLRIRVLKRKDLEFGYRCSNLSGNVVLEAAFKLKPAQAAALIKKRKSMLRFKRNTQPLDSRSAGCVFKNPKNKSFSAAQFIEFSGLKGKRLGGAQVSPKHANFIVNLRNARSSDIIGLMDLIKKRVENDHRVRLEPEIRIL